MIQDNIAQLQATVEHMHKCFASWVESVPVKEEFQGQTVWEGIVQVFDIQGHPDASRCYAWSHGFNDSNKRKFFAVLLKDPVNSPQAAVRAAIVTEYRNKTE